MAKHLLIFPSIPKLKYYSKKLQVLNKDAPAVSTILWDDGDGNQILFI
jgi:hypothetical protein